MSLIPKRVIFVRDFGMLSEFDDLGNAREVLRTLWGVEPEFLCERDEFMPPGPLDLNDCRPDIVLLDFGGMSIAGSWDGAVSNVRYVINWAAEHPSVAVVIWTMFTQQMADQILDEMGERPANVFGYSFEQHDDGWPAVRQWLGLPEVE